METSSPPLSPIRHYISPLETSPGYRDQLRRRTSSFSSNHDRSPTTPRSKHRFSHGSQMSNDYEKSVNGERGGAEGGAGGMGNLADELEQLDDEEEYDESAIVEEGHDIPDKEVRDSGIDVSYTIHSNAAGQHQRGLSKTNVNPDDDHGDDLFSRDLEELLTTIAKMTTATTSNTAASTSSASTQPAPASIDPDPLIPRAIAQLQDLGNQTSLEAATQRLTTSTNSLTAHINTQSKTLQSLTQQTLSPHLLLPLTFSSASSSSLEDILPLLETLLTALPHPDPAPLQKLQRLDHETQDLRAALAQITDTLQMGKQNTAAAGRHLRATRNVVGELRREWDLVERAKGEMEGAGLQKVEGVEGECKDVLDGFERVCTGLRESLEQKGLEVAG